MSYGNQYMHDRNLPRFGYTDAAPLAEGHVLSETKPDGSLCYSLSEEYMDQQLAHRKKLGKWEPGEPDPRLFVCSLQPFVDSVQMTIDGVNAYRKVAQVEFNKWWEMDPNTGNDPETFYGWPVRKYNYLDGHLADATRNVAGYNIYFIRLPEIYLMYADLLKDSDPATALEYVNKVKRRAYGYSPTGPRRRLRVADRPHADRRCDRPSGQRSAALRALGRVLRRNALVGVRAVPAPGQAGGRLLQDGVRPGSGQDEHRLEGYQLRHADPDLGIRIEPQSGYGADPRLLSVCI